MSIGPLQIILILVIVLVVFGAGKLPNVMGDVGKGVRNLKKGIRGDDEEEDSESEPVVKKVAPKKAAPKKTAKKESKAIDAQWQEEDK